MAVAADGGEGDCKEGDDGSRDGGRGKALRSERRSDSELTGLKSPVQSSVCGHTSPRTRGRRRGIGG